MSLIVAEHLHHAFGSQEVLKNISFRLGPDERIGLIGPNGQGKTTLIRLIVGELESTGGKLTLSRNMKIGYLPQVPPLIDGGTIYQTMLAVFDHLQVMEQELTDLAVRISADPDDPDLLQQLGRLQAEFENQGGYTYHTRIEQVLTGLAFDRSMWDRPLTQLSGGQRTRVYLATLLLKTPDLLLLDEPTNHLDLDSVEWLEDYLKSFRGALIVVSHDRYFLDRVTTGTWDVSFGGMETYNAPYSRYLNLKNIRYLERRRQWEAQQEYIEKTRDFIARHLAGQRTKEAQGRRTRLERFLRDQAIEQPREHPTINLSFQEAPRTGDIVLRAEHLKVGYHPDNPLMSVERLEVIRNDRIAIVGPNGSGKTTLLRTILGELKPLAGEVILGSNVNIGYISQIHSNMDPESTALETVMAAMKYCEEEQARKVLGALLLSGDESLKKIKQLSGGQRSRVALARLMMQKVNVLVFDEPTNHLDIPSTEIMQQALQTFDGTVLFVSHDRYLVQAVATHVWAIAQSRVKAIQGSWQDYLDWRAGENGCSMPSTAEDKARSDRKNDYQQAKRDANLLQKLKRRYEKVEKEIEAAEKKLAELNRRISDAGQMGNIALVTELGGDYEKTSDHLQTLMQEWEDLGVQIEQP
ncbi:MAG: ABC-F family ATP-binding cassette domain-containing protein [Phycisphaerae bacterium]|jgi:ATP-binding cassette subfamily F protein 3|nr:ABC-F family ATP-binding cassette domain-containing protein [Phycisphaerae bacterium]